jgi:nicotinate-nucleotide pyrophosphorylase (carboxylating)
MQLPHDKSNFFKTKKYLDFINKYILNELSNDGKDITSLNVIKKNKVTNVKIISKERGILSGKFEIEYFLSHNYPNLNLKWFKNDRDSFIKNDTILSISGSSYDLLKLERVILNILSRMSGITTFTKILQSKYKTPVSATRKTQAGYFDKKAVFVGGGLTHRIGLFDGLLIKENHIFIMGGIEKVLDNIDNIKLENNNFIEIEVETKKEFLLVFKTFMLDKYKDIKKVIMLDNFLPSEIRDLLLNIDKKTSCHNNNLFLEVSGGINKNNIKDYDSLNIDVISMGSLTNSVSPIDFSMRCIN